MAGLPKPTAKQAFDDTLADAESLLALAKALRNRRVRKMRRELRERIGNALAVPKRHWASLDGIESDDFFIVIKPTASLKKADLSETALRPLLRQAYVVVCAAVETFCADRVMERLGSILAKTEYPTRLAEVSMTVGDWLEIESKYERKRWGLRQIIEVEVRKAASAAPAQIGQLFGWVGEEKLLRRVDARRRVVTGKSEKQLATIYARRNRIAHTGDRSGRGRAPITVDEVHDAVVCVSDIVSALDTETRG